MALTAKQISQLQKLVSIASKLLAEAELTETKGRQKSVSAPKSGRRRSGKELTAFRKILKAERKRGVPVAELAKKHGVSSSYIYQLP